MRSHQYAQGRRNGVKACIEWLHGQAVLMNDPHARNLLNSAAWNMGFHFKLGAGADDQSASETGDAALRPDYRLEEKDP